MKTTTFFFLKKISLKKCGLTWFEYQGGSVLQTLDFALFVPCVLFVCHPTGLVLGHLLILPFLSDVQREWSNGQSY